MSGARTSLRSMQAASAAEHLVVTAEWPRLSLGFGSAVMQACVADQRAQLPGDRVGGGRTCR